MTARDHAVAPPSVAPTGATRMLAAFVARLDPTTLPGEVGHQARRLLLDTVGCMIGGHATEAGRLGVRWAVAAGSGPSSDSPVAPLGGGRPAARSGVSPGAGEATPLRRSGAVPGGATVAGTSWRLTPPMAAYANGRLAAVLDADEMWPSSRQASHLAAATVAAALAACEARDASLGDLLASIAAGYETGARVSDSLLPVPGPSSGALRAGWGPGSPVAAAAAAARGRSLGPGPTAHALGIAAGHADPPPLQWTEVRPAPMAKSADAGWHALAGVAAAEMAELGLTGYDGILDGERGLWRALGYGGCDADAMLGGLGERWRIHDAAFKRWPCQYWMHPVLTALERAIAPDAPAPGSIDRIVLETNEKSFLGKFRDPDPPGEIDRSFSLPHAAAMLVMGVPPGPGWLADVTAADPVVVRLRARVEVRLHPDATRVGEWIRDHGYRDLPARATVEASGRTLTAEARFGRGAPWSPETRLDDAALAGKVRELASPLAAAVTGGSQAVDAAIAWIMGANEHRPVRELPGILAGIAGAGDPTPTTLEEP